MLYQLLSLLEGQENREDPFYISPFPPYRYTCQDMDGFSGEIQWIEIWWFPFSSFQFRLEFVILTIIIYLLGSVYLPIYILNIENGSFLTSFQSLLYTPFKLSTQHFTQINFIFIKNVSWNRLDFSLKILN